MSVIKLIGSDPNQVSRNRDLGSLAFQDSESAIIESGRVDVKGGGSNLLLWSEQFNTAPWTGTNNIFTANTTIAPDGTLTAGTFTGINTSDYRLQSTSITATGTTIVTYSAYFKAGTVSSVRLYMFGDTSSEATFDLVAVTATPSGGVVPTASITSVGNGWYRCSITASPAGGSALKCVLYTGVGTYYAWGAQLERSSTLGNYIATESTAITLENALGATQLQVLSSSLIDTTYPMAFELASDTELVVKVKGSDGTVRSATLTLA